MIHKQGERVELLIDTGDEDRNHSIFAQLQEHKAEIESTTGPLFWDYVETRRQCRIYSAISVGGLANQEEWTQTQDAMIQGMILLEATLRPYIRALHS